MRPAAVQQLPFANVSVFQAVTLGDGRTLAVGQFSGNVAFDPANAAGTRSAAATTGFLVVYGPAGDLLDVFTIEPGAGGSSSVSAVAFQGDKVVVAGRFQAGANGSVDIDPTPGTRAVTGTGLFVSAIDVQARSLS